MPEFTAGNIWLECRGERLDEYGEKVKVKTGKAEAKSCFVELPDHFATCEVRWNYQTEASNPEGSRPALLRFHIATLESSSKASTSMRAHSLSFQDCRPPPHARVLSLKERSNPAFVVRPFQHADCGVRDVVQQARSSPLIIKVMITPSQWGEDGETAPAGGRDMPNDPWEGEDELQEHDTAFWEAGVGVSGLLHYSFALYDKEPVLARGYPQISAVFQLCFAGGPCVRSIFNPTGLPSLQSFPKTVPRSAAHPPPLPRATLKPTAESFRALLKGVGAANAGAQVHEESQHCLRLQAEIDRLAAQVANAQSMASGCKKEGEGEGSKRKAQKATIVGSAKRLCLEMTRDGCYKIQIDDEDEVKKEEGEEVRIKEEPGDE